MVNVFAPGATKPVINSFIASPGSIKLGGSSTLSWSVTGCTNVLIAPDVGAVSSNGSRVVRPNNTTTYSITATNEVGTVTATTQVYIVSIPINKVELYSLAAEDGSVRQDGQIDENVMVGYTSNIVGIQGFLSFDISGIPSGVTIKSVIIDLDAGAVQVNGDPFVRMGQLNINEVTFTKLNSNYYFVGPITDAICSFSAWPSYCLNSSLIIAALQEELDAGSDRFQVRMRFEGAPYMEPYGYRWSQASLLSEANYLDFSIAQPKLVIEYEQ
jgi:hypothetical protein